MHGRRILYGLAGVPKSLPPDDKRLPGVVLDPAPLRLNSETLPPAAMPADLADHAARLAAIRAWLHAACGDYGGRQRAFIDAYLAFVAAQLQAERQALTSALSRFDDLYAVEDWTWSALRAAAPRLGAGAGWQLRAGRPGVLDRHHAAGDRMRGRRLALCRAHQP